MHLPGMVASGNEQQSVTGYVVILYPEISPDLYVLGAVVYGDVIIIGDSNFAGCISLAHHIGEVLIDGIEILVRNGCGFLHLRWRRSRLVLPVDARRKQNADQCQGNEESVRCTHIAF